PRHDDHARRGRYADPVAASAGARRQGARDHDAAGGRRAGGAALRHAAAPDRDRGDRDEPHRRARLDRRRRGGRTRRRDHMTDTRSFTIIDGGRATVVAEAEGPAAAKRAEAVGRPVAIDLEEQAAYVGISAAERAKALASLEAPDFTLPDLDGRMHSLSQHRGKKVLLVAYASW